MPRVQRSTPCTQPGCPHLRPCPVHVRLSPTRRGYSYRQQQRAREYLKRHPWCIVEGCGQPSTDADHAPLTRRELVAQGVADPDADEYLQPLCHSHHSRKTALHDGGFGR